MNDIVDGFTLSASQLYLPIVFRTLALDAMEILRRARGYRCREYLIPDNADNPVKAFSQLEQQVTVMEGSYLWAIAFSAPFSATGGDDAASLYLQITDACTETALFSDYVFGNNIESLQPANGAWNRRNPMLMSAPRLIGAPALIDVEIYNKASVDITCQLVLCMAEPSLPPAQMRELLERFGMMDAVEYAI